MTQHDAVEQNSKMRFNNNYSIVKQILSYAGLRIIIIQHMQKLRVFE